MQPATRFLAALLVTTSTSGCRPPATTEPKPVDATLPEPSTEPAPADSPASEVEGIWPLTCACAPECSLSQVENQANRVVEAFETTKSKYKGHAGPYEAHMAAIHANFADCLDNTSLSNAYPEQQLSVEEQRDEHRDEARRLLEDCERRAEPKWVAHCAEQLRRLRVEHGNAGLHETIDDQHGGHTSSRVVVPDPWIAARDDVDASRAQFQGLELTGVGLGAGLGSYGNASWGTSTLILDSSVAGEGAPCETRVSAGKATLTLFFETARPTAKDLERLALRDVLRDFSQEEFDHCIGAFRDGVLHAWESAGGIGVEEMWSVVASTDHEAEYVEASRRRERAIHINRELRVRRAQYGKQIMLNLGSPRPLAAAEEIRLQHLLEEPPSTPWVLPSDIRQARGLRYAQWRREKRREFEAERTVTIEYSVATSAAGVIRHHIRVMPEKGPVDLVLVIDATGSMVDDIDHVRDESVSLFRQLHAKNPDARMGVVVYRDRGDGADWRQLVRQPTSDAASFEQAMASIHAKGGGDADEDVCAGQLMALDEIAWRESSQRFILTVGDADSKHYSDPPTCDEVRTKSTAVRATLVPFHPLGRDVKGFLGTIGEAMRAAK